MKDKFNTVCDKCGRRTWYETEQRCHNTLWDTGEPTRCTGTLRVIDYGELDSRFTMYYEAGIRVEVEWIDGYTDMSGYGSRTDGKKARFWVGRSTGGKPVYLMILMSNSTGGGVIPRNAVKSIKGLETKRRI